MRRDIDNVGVLCGDYDWASVFGEEHEYNCDADVETIDGTDCKRFTRANVAEILALVNGENDGDEWVGIFRLDDGRFLCASGSCDYTGWDCQAGNHLTVASSLESLVRMGVTPEQAARLEVKHPANKEGSE